MILQSIGIWISYGAVYDMIVRMDKTVKSQSESNLPVRTTDGSRANGLHIFNIV